LFVFDTKQRNLRREMSTQVNATTGESLGERRFAKEGFHGHCLVDTVLKSAKTKRYLNQHVTKAQFIARLKASINEDPMAKVAAAGGETPFNNQLNKYLYEGAYDSPLVDYIPVVLAEMLKTKLILKCDGWTHEIGKGARTITLIREHEHYITSPTLEAEPKEEEKPFWWVPAKDRFKVVKASKAAIKKKEQVIPRKIVTREGISLVKPKGGKLTKITKLVKGKIVKAQATKEAEKEVQEIANWIVLGGKRPKYLQNFSKEKKRQNKVTTKREEAEKEVPIRTSATKKQNANTQARENKRYKLSKLYSGNNMIVIEQDGTPSMGVAVKHRSQIKHQITAIPTDMSGQPTKKLKKLFKSINLDITDYMIIDLRFSGITIYANRKPEEINKKPVLMDDGLYTSRLPGEEQNKKLVMNLIKKHRGLKRYLPLGTNITYPTANEQANSDGLSIRAKEIEDTITLGKKPYYLTMDITHHITHNRKILENRKDACYCHLKKTCNNIYVKMEKLEEYIRLRTGHKIHRYYHGYHCQCHKLAEYTSLQGYTKWVKWGPYEARVRHTSSLPLGMQHDCQIRDPVTKRELPLQNLPQINKETITHRDGVGNYYYGLEVDENLYHVRKDCSGKIIEGGIQCGRIHGNGHFYLLLAGTPTRTSKKVKDFSWRFEKTSPILKQIKIYSLLFIVSILTMMIVSATAKLEHRKGKIVSDLELTKKTCVGQVIPSLYGGDCSSINIKQHVDKIKGRHKMLYCWLLGKEIWFNSRLEEIDCTEGGTYLDNLPYIPLEQAYLTFLDWLGWLRLALMAPCLIFYTVAECTVLTVSFFILYPILIIICLTYIIRGDYRMFILLIIAQYITNIQSLECSEFSEFALTAKTYSRNNSIDTTIFQDRFTATKNETIHRCYKVTKTNKTEYIKFTYNIYEDVHDSVEAPLDDEGEKCIDILCPWQIHQCLGFEEGKEKGLFLRLSEGQGYIDSVEKCGCTLTPWLHCGYWWKEETLVNITRATVYPVVTMENRLHYLAEPGAFVKVSDEMSMAVTFLGNTRHTFNDKKGVQFDVLEGFGLPDSVLLKHPKHDVDKLYWRQKLISSCCVDEPTSLLSSLSSDQYVPTLSRKFKFTVNYKVSGILLEGLMCTLEMVKDLTIKASRPEPLGEFYITFSEDLKCVLEVSTTTNEFCIEDISENVHGSRKILATSITGGCTTKLQARCSNGIKELTITIKDKKQFTEILGKRGLSETASYYADSLGISFKISNVNTLQTLELTAYLTVALIMFIPNPVISYIALILLAARFISIASAESYTVQVGSTVTNRMVNIWLHEQKLVYALQKYEYTSRHCNSNEGQYIYNRCNNLKTWLNKKQIISMTPHTNYSGVDSCKKQSCRYTDSVESWVTGVERFEDLKDREIWLPKLCSHGQVLEMWTGDNLCTGTANYKGKPISKPVSLNSAITFHIETLLVFLSLTLTMGPFWGVIINLIQLPGTHGEASVIGRYSIGMGNEGIVEPIAPYIEGYQTKTCTEEEEKQAEQYCIRYSKILNDMGTTYGKNNTRKCIGEACKYTEEIGMIEDWFKDIYILSTLKSKPIWYATRCIIKDEITHVVEASTEKYTSHNCSNRYKKVKGRVVLGEPFAIDRQRALKFDLDSFFKNGSSVTQDLSWALFAFCIALTIYHTITIPTKRSIFKNINNTLVIQYLIEAYMLTHKSYLLVFLCRLYGICEVTEIIFIMAITGIYEQSQGYTIITLLNLISCAKGYNPLKCLMEPILWNLIENSKLEFGEITEENKMKNISTQTLEMNKDLYSNIGTGTEEFREKQINGVTYRLQEHSQQTKEKLDEDCLVKDSTRIIVDTLGLENCSEEVSNAPLDGNVNSVITSLSHFTKGDMVKGKIYEYPIMDTIKATLGLVDKEGLNPTGIAIFKLTGIGDTGFGFNYGEGMYTCYHVTKGRKIYNPLDNCIISLTSSSQDQDIACYGKPYKLDPVEDSKLYYVPNPELGTYILLEKFIEEGNQTYFARVVACEHNNTQILTRWDHCNFSGWSGLPIVNLTTGKPVGVYRGVYYNDNVGTLIPLVTNVKDRSYSWKTHIDKILAGETEIVIDAPTGSGKSTKFVHQLAMEYQRRKQKKTIYVMNPLRSIEGVYQYVVTDVNKDGLINYELSMKDVARSNGVNSSVKVVYGTYGKLLQSQIQPDICILDEVHTEDHNVVIAKQKHWNQAVYVSATATIMADYDSRITVRKVKTDDKGKELYDGIKLSKDLFNELDKPGTLIFCSTRKGCERVAKRLSTNTVVVHSGKPLQEVDAVREDVVWVATDAICSGVTLKYCCRGISDGYTIKPRIHDGVKQLTRIAINKGTAIQMSGRLARVAHAEGTWYQLETPANTEYDKTFVTAMSATQIFAEGGYESKNQAVGQLLETYNNKRYTVEQAQSALKANMDLGTRNTIVTWMGGSGHGISRCSNENMTHRTIRDVIEKFPCMEELNEQSLSMHDAVLTATVGTAVGAATVMWISKNGCSMITQRYNAKQFNEFLGGASHTFFLGYKEKDADNIYHWDPHYLGLINTGEVQTQDIIHRCRYFIKPYKAGSTYQTLKRRKPLTASTAIVNQLNGRDITTKTTCNLFCKPISEADRSKDLNGVKVQKTFGKNKMARIKAYLIDLGKRVPYFKAFIKKYLDEKNNQQSYPVIMYLEGLIGNINWQIGHPAIMSVLTSLFVPIAATHVSWAAGVALAFGALTSIHASASLAGAIMPVLTGTILTSVIVSKYIVTASNSVNITTAVWLALTAFTSENYNAAKTAATHALTQAGMLTAPTTTSGPFFIFTELAQTDAVSMVTTMLVAFKDHKGITLNSAVKLGTLMLGVYKLGPTQMVACAAMAYMIFTLQQQAKKGSSIAKALGWILGSKGGGDKAVAEMDLDISDEFILNGLITLSHALNPINFVYTFGYSIIRESEQDETYIDKFIRVSRDGPAGLLPFIVEVVRYLVGKFKTDGSQSMSSLKQGMFNIINKAITMIKRVLSRVCKQQQYPEELIYSRIEKLKEEEIQDKLAVLTYDLILNKKEEIDEDMDNQSLVGVMGMITDLFSKPKLKNERNIKYIEHMIDHYEEMVNKTTDQDHQTINMHVSGVGREIEKPADQYVTRDNVGVQFYKNIQPEELHYRLTLLKHLTPLKSREGRDIRDSKGGLVLGGYKTMSHIDKHSELLTMKHKDTTNKRTGLTILDMTPGRGGTLQYILSQTDKCECSYYQKADDKWPLYSGALEFEKTTELRKLEKIEGKYDIVIVDTVDGIKYCEGQIDPEYCLKGYNCVKHKGTLILSYNPLQIDNLVKIIDGFAGFKIHIMPHTDNSKLYFFCELKQKLNQTEEGLYHSFRTLNGQSLNKTLKDRVKNIKLRRESLNLEHPPFFKSFHHVSKLKQNLTVARYEDLYLQVNNIFKINHRCHRLASILSDKKFIKASRKLGKLEFNLDFKKPFGGGILENQLVLATGTIEEKNKINKTQTSSLIKKFLKDSYHVNEFNTPVVQVSKDTSKVLGAIRDRLDSKNIALRDELIAKLIDVGKNFIMKTKNRFSMCSWEELGYKVNRQGATGMLDPVGTMGDLYDQPETRSICERIIEQLKNGEDVSEYYVTCHHKVESKVSKRSENGLIVDFDPVLCDPQPRLIQYNAGYGRLVDLWLFSGFLEEHAKEKTYKFTTAGTPLFQIGNLLRQSWDRLNRQNNVVGITGDASRWDHSLGPGHMYAEREILKSVLDISLHKAIDTRYEHVTFPITFTKLGLVYSTAGQRQSGDVLTSIGNTLIHACIEQIAWSEALLERSREEVRLKEFFDSGPVYLQDHSEIIEHFVDGDDNVHMCDSTNLNLIKLVEAANKVMKEYNILIRSGNEEGFKIHKDFEEIDYLSHTYKKVSVRGKRNYMPTRPLSEILGKLVYTTKAETSADLVDSALGNREKLEAWKSRGLEIQAAKATSYLLLYPHIPGVRTICCGLLSLIGGAPSDIRKWGNRFMVRERLQLEQLIQKEQDWSACSIISALNNAYQVSANKLSEFEIENKEYLKKQNVIHYKNVVNSQKQYNLNEDIPKTIYTTNMVQLSIVKTLYSLVSSHIFRHGSAEEYLKHRPYLVPYPQYLSMVPSLAYKFRASTQDFNLQELGVRVELPHVTSIDRVVEKYDIEIKNPKGSYLTQIKEFFLGNTHKVTGNIQYEYNQGSTGYYKMTIKSNNSDTNTHHCHQKLDVPNYGLRLNTKTFEIEEKSTGDTNRGNIKLQIIQHILYQEYGMHRRPALLVGGYGRNLEVIRGTVVNPSAVQSKDVVNSKLEDIDLETYKIVKTHNLIICDAYPLTSACIGKLLEIKKQEGRYKTMVVKITSTTNTKHIQQLMDISYRVDIVKLVLSGASSETYIIAQGQGSASGQACKNPSICFTQELVKLGEFHKPKLVSKLQKITREKLGAIANEVKIIPIAKKCYLTEQIIKTVNRGNKTGKMVLKFSGELSSILLTLANDHDPASSDIPQLKNIYIPPVYGISSKTLEKYSSEEQEMYEPTKLNMQKQIILDEILSKLAKKIKIKTVYYRAPFYRTKNYDVGEGKIVSAFGKTTRNLRADIIITTDSNYESKGQRTVFQYKELAWTKQKGLIWNHKEMYMWTSQKYIEASVIEPYQQLAHKFRMLPINALEHTELEEQVHTHVCYNCGSEWQHKHKKDYYHTNECHLCRGHDTTYNLARKIFEKERYNNSYSINSYLGHDGKTGEKNEQVNSVIRDFIETVTSYVEEPEYNTTKSGVIFMAILGLAAALNKLNYIGIILGSIWALYSIHKKDDTDVMNKWMIANQLLMISKFKGLWDVVFIGTKLWLFPIVMVMLPEMHVTIARAVTTKLVGGRASEMFRPISRILRMQTKTTIKTLSMWIQPTLTDLSKLCWIETCKNLTGLNRIEREVFNMNVTAENFLEYHWEVVGQTTKKRWIGVAKQKITLNIAAFVLGDKFLENMICEMVKSQRHVVGQIATWHQIIRTPMRQAEITLNTNKESYETALEQMELIGHPAAKLVGQVLKLTTGYCKTWKEGIVEGVMLIFHLSYWLIGTLMNPLGHIEEKIFFALLTKGTLRDIKLGDVSIGITLPTEIMTIVAIAGLLISILYKLKLRN